MSKQRPDFSPPPLAADRGVPRAAAQATPEAKLKPKPAARPKAASPWPWGRLARVLATLAILFHLSAVFAAPWFIQLRDNVVPMVEPGGVPRDAQGRVIPRDQLAGYPMQEPVVPLALFKVFFHYANLLYINNGYDFFSPDPTASQLVRYQVYNAAGEEIHADAFPDRKSQWPRLFYHRHMMLAAQVGEFGPDGLRMYARHLLGKHHGARVHLELGLHHLLTPEQVLSGTPLNASETFEGLEEIDEYAAPSSEAPATGVLPTRGGWR